VRLVLLFRPPATRSIPCQERGGAVQAGSTVTEMSVGRAERYVTMAARGGDAAGAAAAAAAEGGGF
jgi:hypothetical protein